ncbi:deaminase domain-containing protein [Clostridium sp.]|uniref:deaminase domain-containing protein n=1 Tax=Clostridium sp. TaxID=1506 RepID=UPI002A90B23D|nr:deaminase domain-containing protein [Clostridium sp.]MDY6013048.1 deaminase domain-containing protein [Clostridium sp.]
MIDKNILPRKRKRDRLKFTNLNDLKKALEKEGYNISNDDEGLKDKLSMIFNEKKEVIETLYICLKKSDITYKADNIEQLIDYIKSIMLFEDLHNRLCKEIIKMESLIIDRVEYERIVTTQDDVENLICIIQRLANDISKVMDIEDRFRLDKLENEINDKHVYAKDIELLRKMILFNNEFVEQTYDNDSKTKTITIKIPRDISCGYIKAKKGTVEYYEHIKKNIPRMYRLIKNMYKYINIYEKETGTFRVNQSKALQDSINIAVAVYNGKDFKAISGSDEIEGFYESPLPENAAFKSSKVNNKGKLGIGYNRINDSEKKILEEIHRQIKEKLISDKGTITLYSKWEPCPSCYLVIDQFLKKHPNINIEVRYIKKYGE